ncbi:unnamed protein product [Trifolium pratense]|uniref:Uncharacterized protein n=1 Tax=Trifolium pratense TaxID=57577 RepID=A0ACB0IIK2_TRIPR|nr:unnamed protein product [Trifolium pratense]
MDVASYMPPRSSCSVSMVQEDKVGETTIGSFHQGTSKNRIVSDIVSCKPGPFKSLFNAISNATAELKASLTTRYRYKTWGIKSGFERLLLEGILPIDSNGTASTSVNQVCTYDSEEEQVNKCRQKKAISKQLKKLQTAGVTPLLQEQLQQLTRQKLSDRQGAVFGKKGKFVVIGQDCVDALHALRSAGEEVRMDIKDSTRQKNTVNSKRKRKEEKIRLRDQRKKQKRKQNKEDEDE